MTYREATTLANEIGSYQGYKATVEPGPGRGFVIQVTAFNGRRFTVFSPVEWCQIAAQGGVKPDSYLFETVAQANAGNQLQLKG